MGWGEVAFEYKFVDLTRCDRRSSLPTLPLFFLLCSKLQTCSNLQILFVELTPVPKRGEKDMWGWFWFVSPQDPLPLTSSLSFFHVPSLSDVGVILPEYVHPISSPSFSVTTVGLETRGRKRSWVPEVPTERTSRVIIEKEGVVERGVGSMGVGRGVVGSCGPRSPFSLTWELGVEFGSEW